MKVFGLFDNNEQTVGYRLAGFDTKRVKTKEETLKQVENIDVKEYGILMINEKVYSFAKERFDEIKKNKSILLVVVK
ncbi:MAG: hypothetical protein IKN74_06705 [Clostridia bacterium]|nr:hypothetical protein [Clostridia bacterium]